MTPELTMYNAPPEPKRDAEFDIVAPDRVAVNGAAPYEQIIPPLYPAEDLEMVVGELKVAVDVVPVVAKLKQNSPPLLRVDEQLVAIRVVDVKTKFPPEKYPRPPLPQVDTDLVMVKVVKVRVVVPDAELQKDPPSLIL